VFGYAALPTGEYWIAANPIAGMPNDWSVSVLVPGSSIVTTAQVGGVNEYLSINVPAPGPTFEWDGALITMRSLIGMPYYGLVANPDEGVKSGLYDFSAAVWVRTMRQ
jgi:hypothetical protein